MSSEPQLIPEFLTLDAFKTAIKSTDTQDDDTYLQFVFNSNKMVHTTIFQYINTPLDRGSIYWSRCSDIAMAYARSMHAEDIELLDKAEHYFKKYRIQMFGEDEKHGLVGELIATRTTRTISAVGRFDPRDQKVPLPSQNDLFVSSQFG